MAFIPFDATEDEIHELSVIREGIPDDLAAPLFAWLQDQLRIQDEYGYDFVHLPLAHEFQTAMKMNFGMPSTGPVEIERFLAAVSRSGQKLIIRLVDFVLSKISATIPDSAMELERLLSLGSSKYTVVVRDGVHRLSTRLPEGVEELAQAAIDASPVAGPLLAKAWHYAYGLDTKPIEAMDLAVKAVEHVAVPVVVPFQKKATLGHVVGAITNNGDWTHGLREIDGKAPSNGTIHNMLQTVWAGHQYRHATGATTPPSIAQAQTLVQLAATLVAWFSSGAIVRDPQD